MDGKEERTFVWMGGLAISSGRRKFGLGSNKEERKKTLVWIEHRFKWL